MCVGEEEGACYGDLRPEHNYNPAHHESQVLLFGVAALYKNTIYKETLDHLVTHFAYGQGLSYVFLLQGDIS